jgi:hypothetical protein
MNGESEEPHFASYPLSDNVCSVVSTTVGDLDTGSAVQMIVTLILHVFDM